MKAWIRRLRRTARWAMAPAVMACMLSAAAVGTVQAAQMEDVKMQGWTAMPDEKKEAFRAGIAQIPDEIVKLHRMEGAKVSFVDGLLSPDGGDGDPHVKGLYWHQSRDIELAVSPQWNSNDIMIAAAHEFGHFLYFQTYPFWMQEAKDQLEAEFAYWKQYSPDCPDQEETFAVVYSMYRGTGGQFLSEECRNMLDEAERCCIWICEQKAENPGWEPGPGMEMPDLADQGDRVHVEGEIGEPAVAGMDGLADSEN